MKEDGIGGCDGFIIIFYIFERIGNGVMLFICNLICEFFKGVGILDDLLIVCCWLDGIDCYYVVVEKELNE